MKVLTKKQVRVLLTPKWSEYIPHEPTPKQHAALLLDDWDELLYGGAAGGGKSDYLLMAALQYVDVPGYNAIILRRTYPQLSASDGLLSRAQEWLAGRARGYDTVKGMPTRYVFPSSATLDFGHCQYEKDRFNYQGPSYQFVGFDELTQFTLRIYLYIMGRIRRLKGFPTPLRVRAASNPGGEGHDWVKARFRIGTQDVETDTSANDTGRRRAFIPATLDDNPHLDGEEYTATLMELHPYERAQLLVGDWDVRPPGSRFKREWFRIIGERPADHTLQWWRRWDLAGTEKNRKNRDPDWTVGTLWTRRHSGVFVCADMQRFRESPGVTEQRIKQTAEIDGRDTKIRIEQEGGSSGKFAIHHLVNQLAGWDVMGIPSTGDKIKRADPYASQAEAGNVELVRGPWNEAFLHEHELFAADCPHDDIVDTGSGAIRDMTLGTGGVDIR